MRWNKRGQAMIWVIIAIVLVASIILFFFVVRRVSVPTEVLVDEVNPVQFIDKCVRKHVNDAIDIMLSQGGFINPGNSKLYNDINVSYLCYNRGNYRPCVNQHPMLLNEMKSEIEDYIESRVDSCFDDLKFELEKRTSDVSLGVMDIDVVLSSNRVYVNINRKVIVTKLGESSGFDNFNVEIVNPAYNLARVSMEIANQEAEYCYFEYVGYSILYSQFRIKVFPMSDDTKIYSILHKPSGKEMNIAIRSCAIPSGL